jgi:hypothetical protein
MTERLVDVLDGNGSVLHTYPITLGELGELGDAADDAAYEAKALEAAAHGRLVRDDELRELTARIHTGRGGQMSAYGDETPGDSETKLGLEDAVRTRAYALWEKDGRPENRASEYWHRAFDDLLRERAYALWQQDGSPEGRADEYWERLVKFQAQ